MTAQRTLVVHDDAYMVSGRFDLDDPFCYFLAVNEGNIDLALRAHDHVLIAMNEVKDADRLASLLRERHDVKLMLDSGAFMLASAHARKHGISIPEALAMHPSQIDGVDELLMRYRSFVADNHDVLWGYVELDFGGPEQKRMTRNAMEREGFRPIPVFHPFTDGWDYFDELAETYERICIGNLVSVRSLGKLRLLASIHARRQAHHRLKWIHALGVSPNEWLFAYPTESCDSTNWLSPIKWAGMRERSCGKLVDFIRRGFIAPHGQGAAASRSLEVGAYIAHSQMLNWQAYLRDREG